MTSENHSNKGTVDADEDDELDFDDAVDAQQEDQRGSEEPNPNSDITLLLKELAENPSEPYDQIAREMEIPKNQATKTINDFVKFLVGTHKEADFPERMRAHYNGFVRLERNKLSGKDMMTLMGLINKFYSKLIASKSTPRERDKLTNKMADLNVPGVIPIQKAHAQEEAPQMPPLEETLTYTDPQPQGQPQQQEPQQQGQAQEPWQPYDNEESLMKFLLEQNIRIRDPNRIRNFMMFFRQSKNEMVNNPQKLYMMLKMSFDDRTAETVWQMFEDYKHQVTNDSTSLYRLTGASDYKPLNQNLEQLLAGNNPALRMLMNEGMRGGRPSGGGYAPQGQDPYADSAFDRQLDRMQKMITMTLMQNMANNSMGQKQQQGGMMGELGQYGVNPNDYDIYEDIDNEGRIRGRRMIRKAGYGYGYPAYPGQQNQNGNDQNTKMMMEFIKMTQEASNADRQLLMQKLLSNDSQGLNDVVGTILKQAVGVMGNSTDPLQQLNKTMELADKMNQIRRPDTPKSMDEKKMELEFILAKRDFDERARKEQRDYERQMTEARSADDRIGHVIDGLAGAAKDVLTPAVQAVTQSFGAGLAGRMGIPTGVPGQMPPGYPPANQPPQKVIIREVPAAVQQQQQQPQQVIAPPQYTQQTTAADMAMQQQAEAIRREQELAQMEMQQDNRPLDEQLKDFQDDEIDGLALKMEGDMIHNERTFHKVLAERNRRRLRAGGQPLKQPERKYVSPITQAIATHEQEKQHVIEQQNQPQEPISVFDEEEGPTADEQYQGPEPNFKEPTEDSLVGVPGTGEVMQEPTSAVPSAVDLTDAYDDEEVQESLRLEGQMHDVNSDTRFGVPGTSSNYVPNTNITTRPPVEGAEPGEVTVNADDIDMENDTVVEG